MDTDSVLEASAKFSVVVAFFIVTYFLVITTWRITRFPVGAGWPLFHLGRWGGRQELHQRPTSLPFTFALVDNSVEQFDSFTMRLTTTGTVIKCLWGVDAAYLFKLITMSSWGSITEMGDDEGKELVNCVQTLPIARNETNEYELNITTPTEMNWQSISSQYRYPLALFVYNDKEADLNPVPLDEDIVGLCIILHVKNPLISKPTAILAQYIKLRGGQAHKLQPLYVVDGGENENSVVAASSSEPFSSVVCTVCQSFPVSRAIVPCGHVCLCVQCFGKVLQCPICRGPITYFFKTRSEDYIGECIS